MATRTRAKPRRRRGRAGRRPAARRSRPAGPGPIRRAGSRLGRHLSPRAADVLGVAVAVLGVLTILGLWFGAGGPFGRAFEVAVRGAVGVAGYAVPVVCLWWAAVLVRG